MLISSSSSTFFFINDSSTTEIYTLSLHDALPILVHEALVRGRIVLEELVEHGHAAELAGDGDRKSTRLNSSHLGISYAVFCLKKKKKTNSSHIFIHIYHHIYYIEHSHNLTCITYI